MYGMQFEALTDISDAQYSLPSPRPAAGILGMAMRISLADEI